MGLSYKLIKDGMKITLVPIQRNIYYPQKITTKVFLTMIYSNMCYMFIADTKYSKEEYYLEGRAITCLRRFKKII